LTATHKQLNTKYLQNKKNEITTKQLEVMK